MSILVGKTQEENTQQGALAWFRLPRGSEMYTQAVGCLLVSDSDFHVFHPVGPFHLQFDAFHRVHVPVMKILGILTFYITTDKLLHWEQSLLSFRRGMIPIKNSPEFEPPFPD